jgi:peptide-methionine (S)-S-oxide reductase
MRRWLGVWANLLIVGFAVIALPAVAQPMPQTTSQAKPQATAIGTTAATLPTTASSATAIFAGGCFWCTESDFEKLPGVISAVSGYTAGKTPNPTYESISSGKTGHTEAVRVTYDPTKVSYSALLEYFWRTIDPTVKNAQFCDVGSQYRSAIFYDTEEQRATIEASKAALLKAGKIKEIHTEIAKASVFYVAEEYHQDYYKKNPIRYNYYRTGCGRDARLAQVWGPNK